MAKALNEVNLTKLTEDCQKLDTFLSGKGQLIAYYANAHKKIKEHIDGINVHSNPSQYNEERLIMHYLGLSDQITQLTKHLEHNLNPSVCEDKQPQEIQELQELFKPVIQELFVIEKIPAIKAARVKKYTDKLGSILEMKDDNAKNLKSRFHDLKDNAPPQEYIIFKNMEDKLKKHIDSFGEQNIDEINIKDDLTHNLYLARFNSFLDEANDIVNQAQTEIKNIPKTSKNNSIVDFILDILQAIGTFFKELGYIVKELGYIVGVCDSPMTDKTKELSEKIEIKNDINKLLSDLEVKIKNLKNDPYIKAEYDNLSSMSP